MESELPAAHELLYFSFQHCLAGSVGNKRRVLIYLVPVRMLHGYLPASVRSSSSNGGANLT